MIISLLCLFSIAKTSSTANDGIADKPAQGSKDPTDNNNDGKTSGGDANNLATGEAETGGNETPDADADTNAVTNPAETDVEAEAPAAETDPVETVGEEEDPVPDTDPVADTDPTESDGEEEDPAAVTDPAETDGEVEDPTNAEEGRGDDGDDTTVRELLRLLQEIRREMNYKI